MSGMCEQFSETHLVDYITLVLQELSNPVNIFWVSCKLSYVKLIHPLQQDIQFIL